MQCNLTTQWAYIFALQKKKFWKTADVNKSQSIDCLWDKRESKKEICRKLN